MTSDDGPTNTMDEFRRRQQRLLRRFGVDARSRFFEVPAVSGAAHVLSCGEGAPVLMVPGFSDPAAMWAPLMAELDGFRLHAVDRPSIGLTGHASHTPSGFRELAVGFLEQVLDALELERPVVLANSIGSLWSTWLALDRPGRVSALVHVGCPATLLGTSAPLPMRLLSVRPLGRLLVKLSRPSREQVHRFARMIGADLSEEPELTDLLVAAQELPGAGRAMVDLVHSVVGLTGPRPEVALGEEELKEVEQPTLLVWGEKDPFGGPEVGEEAARLLPDAELHVVAGGGHVPWANHAREVAAAVQPFLELHA